MSKRLAEFQSALNKRPLRAGDYVEVMSAAEIERTLDDRGTLDGVHFMSEMLQYCGRRFVVYRRAERICDTVNYSGIRRMPDTVLLSDLRCDGTGHDGCQAECRLFWKESWLRRIESSDPQTARDGDAASGVFAARLPECSKSTVEVDGKQVTTYSCQATCVPHASKHLALWDARSYMREFTSGNVPLGRLLRVTARAAVEEPLRKLHLMPDIWLPGVGTGKDPEELLNLQPGEWVQVKNRDEIAQFLSPEGRSRGMWFDREMLPYCGKKYQVRQRVSQFIDERDGRMKRIKNCVTLEGVVCTGNLSLRRWFCPREIFPYWRESWLRRVTEP